MKASSDTIAAIATTPGEGGISIVRISGPQSYAIADAVFRCAGPSPSLRAPNTFVHGFVVAGGRGEETRIDDAVLLLYRAPHSYTGEDVVEVQGHGGTVSSRRVLQVILEAGARSAEAGEFTKRAFLNGKMDLVQAEAVADLIAAKSDLAAKVALEQLQGRLSDRLSSVYDGLVTVAADIESTLDFEVEELPESVGRDISQRLARSRSELESLLATWHEGHILRDGPLVVIAGQPNAGKSTLMNKLLGRERAIVADVPGTTRDTIEERLDINGIPVRLVDTAGLRETECGVEKEGVTRARRQIDQADLILYVIDASKDQCSNELRYLDARIVAKCILILNKIDIGCTITDSELTFPAVVRSSLASGAGLCDIQEKIALKVGLNPSRPLHAAISSRHRTLVQASLNALNSLNIVAADLLEKDAVISAAAVRQAIESLGLILGRTYSDDLLESVFSRFCVGK